MLNTKISLETGDLKTFARASKTGTTIVHLSWDGEHLGEVEVETNNLNDAMCDVHEGAKQFLKDFIEDGYTIVN